MIDKLSIYYGLAIRRNCDSVEKIRDAICATFYYYLSDNEQLQHEKYLPGSDSWCSQQKAKAEGKLAEYKHDYKSLPPEVLNVIRHIYEDLNTDTLLEPFVRGYTQNNNESLNNLIQKISSKKVHSGLSIIEIAVNIAVCLFNERSVTLSKIMQTIQIDTRFNAHRQIAKKESRHLSVLPSTRRRVR